MNTKWTKLIMDSFMIKDIRDRIVPFRLNAPQNKIALILAGMDPARIQVLKARQEGMTSFFLAVFALDFLTIPYSNSVVFSHKKEATQELLQKVKFYLDSYAQKHGQDEFPLERDSKYELVNKLNGARFYIQTANSKSSIRGNTVRNILFSEMAFYPESFIQNAFLGAVNAVPDVKGTRIIIESTANGENQFKDRWDLAMSKKTNYQPIFFAAKDFYSKEFLAKKRAEIGDENLFKQEYPDTPEEAFITTGSPYFDIDAINTMKVKAETHPILYEGDITMSGDLLGTLREVRHV